MHRHYESKEIVKDYCNYRPQYGSAIASNIINCIKNEKKIKSDSNEKLGFMVDVGCGAGQSTVLFSHYFDKILGIDPSPNQIQHAKENNKSNHISYDIFAAETIPVTDKSVDVIVSGEAVHWFDIPKFLKEADRVLKPGGCLALFGYWTPIVTEIVGLDSELKCAEATKMIEESVVNVVKLANRYSQCGILQRKFDDVYQAIPYSNKTRLDDHIQSYNWNLDQLLGLLRSIDSYDVAPDRITEFENNLRQLWSDEEQPPNEINMKIHFEFFTYMSFKNNK